MYLCGVNFLWVAADVFCSYFCMYWIICSSLGCRFLVTVLYKFVLCTWWHGNADCFSKSFFRQIKLKTEINLWRVNHTIIAFSTLPCEVPGTIFLLILSQCFLCCCIYIACAAWWYKGQGVSSCDWRSWVQSLAVPLSGNNLRKLFTHTRFSVTRQ